MIVNTCFGTRDLEKAGRFYDALTEIPDFRELPVTVAAQLVQRSAYGDAYADHEPAARVLASAGRPQWTLLALITDGEEAGLMGAAALVTDREVTSRLRAYLNLESIGSSGTSVLFETGPGNGWLVSPWARRAPHPRGSRAPGRRA